MCGERMNRLTIWFCFILLFGCSNPEESNVIETGTTDGLQESIAVNTDAVNTDQVQSVQAISGFHSLYITDSFCDLEIETIYGSVEFTCHNRKTDLLDCCIEKYDEFIKKAQTGDVFK
jgi:hypothetical protein